MAGAARLAIEHGADFVKTSTGKIPVGATLEAVRSMAAVVAETAKGGRTVGLKPSGGIRTFDEAMSYIAAAESVLGTGWATPSTFRFGATGLLDALLAVVDEVVDEVVGGDDPRRRRRRIERSSWQTPTERRGAIVPGPSPRSSGDRASASGAVCAGSNPAEGASEIDVYQRNHRRRRCSLVARAGPCSRSRTGAPPLDADASGQLHASTAFGVSDEPRAAHYDEDPEPFQRTWRPPVAGCQPPTRRDALHASPRPRAPRKERSLGRRCRGTNADEPCGNQGRRRLGGVSRSAPFRTS